MIYIVLRVGRFVYKYFGSSNCINKNEKQTIIKLRLTDF